MLKRILIGLAAALGALYLWNASWLAPDPGDDVRIIAHRGLHQNFDLSGVKNDTCTATRIREPIVPEIENTIPAMQAAFAAKADVVELDVHPTTDGRFAVFHDWTLDCRTNGTGETRSHDLAYLKGLDVGYGYTADGGRTFPLRGTGVARMPSLEDVLTAMPNKQFIINFKSNDPKEGAMLADFVRAHPQWESAVWGVYGGDKPVFTAKASLPDIKAWGGKQMTSCLLQYIGYGWTGYMPPPCHDTMIMVPVNFTWLLWGWPNRFLDRMRSVGSEVILIGPYSSGDAGTSGIDTADQAAAIPSRFPGYVWTNEIASIAPLLRP